MTRWEINDTIIEYGDEAFTDCNADEADGAMEMYREDLEHHISESSNMAYPTIGLKMRTRQRQSS